MIVVGLLDVPALVGLGFVSAILFKRRLRERSVNWYLFLTLLCLSVFWLNLASANLSSFSYWVVDVSAVSVPSVVGILYGLSYPLWFRTGGELGFLLVGRQADQGGLLWVFRLKDGTDPIEPSWTVNKDADRKHQSAGTEEE